jgi:predicted RNA-binding Zn-ribbon protein involved in translation (DUF1610 family)
MESADGRRRQSAHAIEVWSFHKENFPCGKIKRADAEIIFANFTFLISTKACGNREVTIIAGMSEQPVEYSCPHCDATIQSASMDAGEINCPNCGEVLILPSTATADPVAELDAQRIHKFAAVRRAAYRARSYCVIAVVGCVVGAIELVFHGIRIWGLGKIRAVAYFIVAIGLLWAAKHFAVLAAQHHREAKRSALPPPTATPDFSTLGDGRQIVRDLERM